MCIPKFYHRQFSRIPVNTKCHVGLFKYLILKKHRFGRSFSFTWHSTSPQTFPKAKGPVLPTLLQKRHLPVVAIVVPESDIVFGIPFRNSTNAFRVDESTRAINQNSLIRPQPSCRSTFIDSSSSLQTYHRKNLVTSALNEQHKAVKIMYVRCDTFLTCVQVFFGRWRIRSHSVHRSPQSLHWSTARVSPSSWFMHFVWNNLFDIGNSVPNKWLNYYCYYYSATISIHEDRGR